MASENTTTDRTQRYIIGRDERFNEELVLAAIHTHRTQEGEWHAYGLTKMSGYSSNSLYILRDEKKILAIQSWERCEWYALFSKGTDQWHYSSGVVIAREMEHLIQSSSVSCGNVVHGTEMLESLWQQPFTPQTLLPPRYPIE